MKKSLPNRIIHCGLLAVVLALFGCGAPQMAVTHIGGDLTPSDFKYPDKNPTPSQSFVINGVITGELDVKLTALYITNGSTFCRTTSSFIAGSVEGATSPSLAELPLPLMRDGNRFSAAVTVDAFLPGACGWQFSGVSANVSRNGQKSISNLIIRAKDMWNTPPAITASNVPVTLRCDFRVVANDNSHRFTNACFTRAGMKNHDVREYRFSPDTRVVTANFLDETVP